MSERIRKLVVVVIRVLLGLVFLLSGIPKFGAKMQTLAAVYSYQIVLPDWVADAIATSLPWVETILGIALLVGVGLPWVFSVAGAVLMFFTFVTAQAWWRGLPIDCGCFDYGALNPVFEVLSSPGGATVRNLVLLFMLGIAFALHRQSQRAS